MRAVLIRWVHVLGAAWPRMLAWYLAGEAVRYGIIQIAAPLAGTDKVLAMLLVPLAILARLIAYIGMFLAARDAMLGYRRVVGDAGAARSLRARAVEFTEVTTAAIVPFFILYDLIGGVAADVSDYAVLAFRSNFLVGDDPTSGFALQVGDGPGVLIVFVTALGARLVLKRFGSRLPAPLAFLDIYLDAIWVFVAVNGANSLLGPLLGWWQDRAIVVAFGDVRQELSDLWSGFRLSLAAVDVILPLLLQVVLLPLAWAVIAAVVYSRAAAELRAGEGEDGVERRLASLRRSLPPVLRDLVAVVSEEWDEKGPPAIVSFRIIRRTGLVTILSFLGVSALLYAGGRWLERGIILGLGPHEDAFWVALAPAIGVLAGAVAEPIRLSLLAAFVDRGLEQRMADVGIEELRGELAEATPDESPDALPEPPDPDAVAAEIEEREDAYEDASDPGRRAD